MNADLHFAKGERFDRAQERLIAETDCELIIEGCYYAVFGFILAGAEWRGVRHSDNHPHAEALSLLTRAAAPAEALAAWSSLERSRAGRVYGKLVNCAKSSSSDRQVAPRKSVLGNLPTKTSRKQFCTKS
jgi:hypothetical protein